MTTEQVHAKKLYAEGKTPAQIAKKLHKSGTTIYRWIAENREEFDEARKLAEITTDSMKDILDEKNKKLLLQILQDKDQLLDPKAADALIKIANVLEKMDQKAEREEMKKLRQQEIERGVVIVDDITYKKLAKQAGQKDFGAVAPQVP